MEILDFAADISWPVVTLIGILILGPGGVLKSSIVGLADKLISINSSVEEFKKISDEFNERQRAIGESLQWLKESGNELARISSSLDSVRENTNEIVLAQGEKQISEVAGDAEELEQEQDIAEGLSATERYDAIYDSWGTLTEIIRQRIGPDNYDGRAIGAMARRLSHRGRANAISKDNAELIESLHSQFKRFARLSATKDEWLSAELYRNFMHGIERARKDLT